MKKADSIHYFNRCRRCAALITKLEIRAALGHKGGEICPCGSGMFSPSNLHWYEHVYPKVAKMYWAKLRGKLVPAPPPSYIRPVPPRVEIEQAVKPSEGMSDQMDSLEEFDTVKAG